MSIPTSDNSPSGNPLTEAERFRLLVANVTDYAIYMLSPEGIVSSWNAGAERFKGYKSHEIIGQHFSRFYTEEDRAVNLPVRALDTAINHGKFEDEGWRVRKDGSRFWASVIIDPIKDDSGTLIGFAKVTRDITDKKQAAESLHASEERFRLLVQSVTDYAIYMLSPEGIITNWNSGAKRIKGYEDSEVVGTHFSRFYTEEDRQKGLPKHALSVAAATGMFESEGWRVRKDGSRFWAHVVIDSIRNALGELIGFAKITRDVTERREASEALEKAQAALFQAQKLESIGLLTGGIAHDFNNLLSVITNGLSVLRISMHNPQELRVLDSMERAAVRGAALIQQLLSFAKQQSFHLEQRNINRVIESFESVLRRACSQTVRFDIHLSPGLPLVEIDVAQFESSLLNLVINARDAIPDGGNILLQTEVRDLGEHEVEKLPAGRYIKTTVMDTGHGIPADIILRIIEPFFTTKPMGKGTGLGLSQVYGFAQQAKGGLEISSVEGHSTVVSLYLPTLERYEEETVFHEQLVEKALIVDDQADVLEMAAEVFRTLGYEVITANSGFEALDIIKRSQGINVIFSDVMMPGMSGIELGHKARTMIPQAKILLASGYTAPAIKEQFGSLDSFEFISKPYRLADIARKLRAS